MMQLALVALVAFHAPQRPPLRLSSQLPLNHATARLPLAPRMLIKVGDQVIAGNDWNSSSPEYGVVRAQAYELKRVYFQGVSGGEIRRVDVESLDAPPPEGCAGYTRYLTLWSPRYHSETRPIVVRPEEVKVVAVKDEVADSAWLALPGLLWVWVAYSIYQYGESHGFIF